MVSYTYRANNSSSPEKYSDWQSKTVIYLDVTNPRANINVELQDSVETILQRHLTEYDAMDGVAIVMETQSGRIRAMAWLVKEDDSTFLRADSLAGVGRSSALMRTISILAALNTGKVNPDTKVDVGEGVYLCGKDTIFDHNWRRGGYGDMTPLSFRI